MQRQYQHNTVMSSTVYRNFQFYCRRLVVCIVLCPNFNTREQTIAILMTFTMQIEHGCFLWTDTGGPTILFSRIVDEPQT